jgi:hypothetical protein
MTKLNNEIRELAIDELDEISGGMISDLAAYASKWGHRVGQGWYCINGIELSYCYPT